MYETIPQNYWITVPFPFCEISTAIPLRPLDTACIFERLLEDSAGLAGVIAAAAQSPECDEDDVKFATRLLAEHLHATIALWR